MILLSKGKSLPAWDHIEGVLSLHLGTDLYDRKRIHLKLTGYDKKGRQFVVSLNEKEMQKLVKFYRDSIEKKDES